MSMQTLTILQFMGTLAAYLGMTVLLPAFVFYRKVSGERFCVRFMIYLVIGNVYLMNMVMVLQLLHISNWFTLVLGTVLPVLWAMARVHNVTIKDGILGAARSVNSFLSGTMGGRLLFSRMLRFIGRCLKTGILRLLRSIRKNFFDWTLTVGCIVAILWLYGSNLIWNMGYCTSDIPVHNYWINAMSRNEMFIAGVYPHGFHCMIYYLHEVFGFRTFVLLRVFCLVQNLLVHMVLLAFLKSCCRVKYTPYFAMILYILANIWNKDTYTRYFSSLPQEFGMIFILPSIYFLYAFFENRKHENKAKGWKVHSTRYLLFFALSFSATLAAHFYNTMVAGVFCVGVAMGFLGVVFRREYFGRILLTGILSIVLAVLPMAVAFAMGRPLEGSLRWGMSVISGSQNDSESKTSTQTDTSAGGSRSIGGASGQAAPDSTVQQGGASVQGTPGSMMQQGGAYAGDVSGNLQQGGTSGGDVSGNLMQQGGASDGTEFQVPAGEAVTIQENLPPPKPAEPLGVRVGKWIKEKWKKTVNLARGLRDTMSLRVMNRVSLETVTVIILFTFSMGFMGLFYLLQRKTRHYGSILLSVVFCLLMLYVILMAVWFGIPALMDQSRCSIYIAYIISAAVALAVDAVVSLASGWITTPFLTNLISLAGVFVMLFVMGWGGMCKEPLNITALESNDAITCLTNILWDNPRFQFTVCSANDELRMVEDYGYHFETITFLQEMEGEKQEGYLTIPTRKVYFFIEKIPIDYTMPYEGSGRKVSEVGAFKPLPYGSGLSIYKGPNRYTVMSKMYFWALSFKKMYPNEMKVYYETDAFICYEVEQNTYRLFDFSIDYGYNSYDRTAE